ncbi:sugar nucleotide-binding protein [Dactylosporangium vinaceum]|uniref:SDR family oxidoreductase n=1 Tax=Dactylosporangium vinaceum TaxID=53362 RepID=A0ABV5MCE6_9ACTN|nr:sugar nucleotide-binding protein [Dactylosporangium vinaceum]UAB92160.1 sugar nucleotide-binding protein [Dactylosporangium vinaceum]
MARILITGATGSLGRRVATLAVAAGHTVLGTHVRPWIEAVDRGRGVTEGKADAVISPVRVDIRDRDAVRDVVDAVRPDLVIHTAAGRDRNDWAANADGAANVALACDERVRLVHVSSDAVFSGRAGREYTEDDHPDPIYPYGAAKAAAETAVRAIAPGAVVVRTSLIMADGGSGHEQLTYDLLAGRVDGALFTDEIRKPIHVDDLADALLELGGGDVSGVVHVAGPDAVSRYDLGVLVARRDGLDPGPLRAATGSGRPGDVRLGIGPATGLLRTRLRGAYEFMRAG